LLAFWLAVVFYGLGLIFGLPTLTLISKPLPTLALASSTFGAPGAALVTVGLAFSALGDLLLELGSGATFFLAGMMAFGAAHVAYVAAFLERDHQPRLLALAPFLVWGAALLRWLWSDLGSLAVPVLVYTVLLVAMMWRATATSLATERRDVMVGAVLFGLSDSLIALDRFHGPVPGARWLIILIYWTGQFRIARSVLPERRA
jgi:alkenylglycerophosphocholine hydrolase